MGNKILQKLESSIEESIKPEVDVPLRVVTEGARAGESQGRARAKGFYNIEIDRIVADPQIREQFENIEELAASIRNRGVDSPVIVRYVSSRSKFVIIAGERRYRAAKLAGLKVVPCNVKPEDISEAEVLEIQVTENVQRESLNPIEEAMAYQKLKDNLCCTAKEVAKRVGKNESTVTRALRYLRLPSNVQQAIATGKIKKTTARELARIDDKKLFAELVEKALSGNLSSVDVEQAASKKYHRKNSKNRGPFPLSFVGEYGLEVVIRRKSKSGEEKLTYDHIDRVLEIVQAEVQHLIKNKVVIEY